MRPTLETAVEAQEVAIGFIGDAAEDGVGVERFMPG